MRLKPYALIARPLVLAALMPAAAAQALPLRAAYEFTFGKAWSAEVDLPAYSVLDLGLENEPLAVNDAGVVLLRAPDQRLLRWAWGRTTELLGNFTAWSQAHLNERGTVAAINADEHEVAQVHFWPAPGLGHGLLDWGDELLAPPHDTRLYALNDFDQLALVTEATAGSMFLPDRTIEVETNLAHPGGGWTELAHYDYIMDSEFNLSQGGRLYEVYGMNNYGETVGLVYEDQATSTWFNPDPVYTYQDEFFARNITTALNFHPSCVNDAGTIVGSTPGPLFGMVVLDAFGQRDIGGYLSELGTTRPLLSNPADGMEEIVLGRRYWKRMTERNLQGQPTGSPSPEFWEGTLDEIVPDPGPWRDLNATCISANGRIAGTGSLSGGASGPAPRHGFLLVPAALVPDWDRDGCIDARDARRSQLGEPLRFWVNDDDDDGDLARSWRDDFPGSTSPDWQSPGVDGLRDVADFFAVHIDLQKVLQALGDLNSVEVVLRHAQAALNFVYTNLQPQEAGAIHRTTQTTGYGPGFDEALATAPCRRVDSSGVSLAADFLANLQAGNRGVLLFEAAASTTAPLVMELRVDGHTVLTSSLLLSISPVADMFRVINLRNADPKFDAADPGPWPTRLAEPANLPDGWLAGFTPPLRTLVHIHGYNWSGEESPAAHAEVFKRFFQAGSHARFIGVSWRGDQGTLDLTGSSFEYNENVINAFVTAPYLATALAPFASPFTSVFAHSLGNMVASSAIVDHGLALSRYLMINAAVPAEAYLGGTTDRRLMVHPDWKDEGTVVIDYAEHLLAPNWCQLFGPGDRRSALGWKNRFEGASASVICTNFHSSGEDVLRPGTGDIPGLFGEVAAKERVWVYNEMVKGTNTLTANLAGEVHGGWGFNRHYMDWVDPNGAAHQPPGSWVPMSTAEADLIDPQELVAEPFFKPFSSGDSDFPDWGDGGWLYADAAEANARLPELPLAGAPIGLIKNHAKVLAEAIPAHSAPAGSTPLPSIPLLQNIDMDKVFRDTAHWPARDNPDSRDRWLHSDYLAPALSHVAGLFLKCVEYINYMP